MADSTSPKPAQKGQTVRERLGDMADRLRKVAVDAASNGASQKEIEIAMDEEMGKWSCALHPEDLTWRWYNHETGEWGGACQPS